jgi:long-chain acyl-CoA synthetase
MLRSAELVGQACVIGEGREYLVALITLDPEVTLAWARARGMDHVSLADLARDSVVRAELRSAIHEINAGLSRASHIQRFAVLGHEWPPDSDELTATMKLRRQQIHAKYAIEIEALYGPDHETI